MENAKICRDCKQTKPRTEFPLKVGKGVSSGRRLSRCRQCFNTAARAKAHAAKGPAAPKGQPYTVQDGWRAKKKRCATCKLEKPRDQFDHKSRGTRLRRDCRDCYSRRAEKPLADRRRRADRNALRLYGITRARFDQIVASRISCDICGRLPEEAVATKAVLHWDHDHESRRFRGLLCHSCNAMIGFARENPATLRRAADYLESFLEPDPAEGL